MYIPTGCHLFKQLRNLYLYLLQYVINLRIFYKSHDRQLILCSINAQHNCARNKCTLTAPRSQRVERETVESASLGVDHVNPTDLILNTAKMRDAKYIQLFAYNPDLLDTESLVQRACEIEQSHLAPDL